MFCSVTTGLSDPPLAINGHSSAAGWLVGGALADRGSDEVEAEVMLDASSVLGPCLSLFVDRLFARERKGRRVIFWILAFRRAGSAAVGSSSGRMNSGKRGFEEDEAEMSAMME